MLEHRKRYIKSATCRSRIRFLEDCLRNDVIPNFLRFRIPENGCFEPTIVHNFQRRLLKAELSKSIDDKNNAEIKLTQSRAALKLKCPAYLLPSVILYLRHFSTIERERVDERLKTKLANLAIKQERPLRNTDNAVKVMCDVKIPQYVLDLLSFGPKHPVKDKFNEVDFLADMDLIISLGKDPEICNELNSIAGWYCKVLKRQQIDRAVEKTRQFLKRNGLKAVPFDKGVGYCIMAETEYWSKIDDVLQPPQFQKLDVKETSKKPHALMIEDEFNRSLLDLKDRDEIDESFYKAVRSVGGQPARLYGLAKVHKKNTPLRPVLSLPGSCYEPLTNRMACLLEDLPEAQIETSSSDIKDTIASINLEDGEVMMSLDVKSLYTNVPVDESIKMAADLVYSRPSIPEFSKDTFITLLGLAVKNVSIRCESSWYSQVDGLAMGSKLSVYLANIWMRKFEPILSGHGPLICDWVDPQPLDPPSKDNICGRCEKLVTFRGYSVQCKECNVWFHRKCTILSVPEIKKLKPGSWACGCTQKLAVEPTTIQPETLSSPSKIFARYVDDIVRSVKEDEIDQLLENANKIHQNLEFTIEKEHDREIPFLDLLIRRDDTGRLSSSWYGKPTDTGVTLNYHACAPMRYKRNIVEGAVHRIHHTTTSWYAFDKGIERLKKSLEANQYPPNFYNPIINDSITKIREQKVHDSLKTLKKPTEKNVKDERPLFITQYRGKTSDELSRRLRKIIPLSVVFTTRKLKTCLPSLKAPISKDLRSRVVYQIDCTGCGSCYVGQTIRHLRTRLTEHLRETAPVGSHLKQCAGTDNWKYKVLDGSRSLTSC